jgi:hypothetical protein
MTKTTYKTFKGCTVASGTKLYEMLDEVPQDIRAINKHFATLDATFRKQAGLSPNDPLDFLRPVNHGNHTPIEPISGVPLVRGAGQGEQLEPSEGAS